MLCAENVAFENEMGNENGEERGFDSQKAKEERENKDQTNYII